MANPSFNRTFLLVLYGFVVVFALKWIFPQDMLLGIILFFGLLIPFFFLLRWPHTPGPLLIGLLALLTGKLAYAVTTDPLAGPDEINYFEQVSSFERLSDFMPYALQHISGEWANMSAYPIFGLLYMPFFKWIEVQEPLPIIAFNALLFVLIVNQTYRLNESYLTYPTPGENRSGFHSMVILGLLLSPSFMLMTSIFAKDVTCVLLGVYAAGLLLRRKYIWFVIVMVYATGLRDYAIVYTLGFYFFYAQRFRSAVAVMLGAMAILAVQVGPTGLINSVLLTIFLFVSPNPVNPGNWDSEVFLRTLEAVWMLVILGLSAIVFMKYKETRKFYILAFILLYTYACTLVLVGYVTVTGRELEYGVGTIGDNMVRKKLPVLPLLYIMQGYTLVWFARLCRTPVRRSAAAPMELTLSTSIGGEGEDDLSNKRILKGGGIHAGS
ncbi:hypothetical protein [Paenibacillus abyssi]|uniref:Uncharacterized protein n=1 Tax=Paenibacillus abyssi TaxID=1340531 RepID=A0A917FPY6_9BACL|nr:hypothetical protein [Paenibacillus abyssi]GGF98554.1 hypothetical protein GCM10010916_14750 [Paenibacillus abyssi]